MLLSKLNSVGAIFISCPEAADVIRRIARRESVVKGRERFTILLSPIFPFYPLSLHHHSLSCPPSLYSPVSVYVHTYARCLLSPHIRTKPFMLVFSFFPDVSFHSFLRSKYLPSFIISLAFYIDDIS